MTGPLALIGGTEWTDGCDFDAALLEMSGGTEVTMLPGAAAYENPSKAIDRAEHWFAGLGATVRVVPVYRRAESSDTAAIDAVRSARFIYLADGSAAHLRSMLKDT